MVEPAYKKATPTEAGPASKKATPIEAGPASKKATPTEVEPLKATKPRGDCKGCIRFSKLYCSTNVQLAPRTMWYIFARATKVIS